VTGVQTCALPISKDFASPSRIKFLKETKANLEELAANTQKWVDAQIKAHYIEGASVATKLLKSGGVLVKDDFTQLDNLSVKALVDDTLLSFGDSIQGFSRSINRLMTEAEKQIISQRLAVGRIKGSTMRDITNRIKGLLNENFLGMRDKGGKVWQLDRYAEMLARTKLTEATNRGVMNQLLQNDFDLVKVTNHGTNHTECKYWEGKILSITGNTKGYPSYDDAVKSGLFHPNCEHRVVPFSPEFEAMSKKWANYNW
jgi:hypothetical protein